MPPRLHYYIRFLFGLTRWELRGIAALIGLVVLGMIATEWINRGGNREVCTVDFMNYVEQNLRVKRITNNRMSKHRFKYDKDVAFEGGLKWERNHSPPHDASKQVVDINSADSLTWVGLVGIGPSLAHRIVAFREKLGGFYSVEQLKEVYGLDSNWVNGNRTELKLGKGIFRMLKINQLEWKLLRHPYLSYAQAKFFLQYRQQHGPLKNWEELKEMKLWNEKEWLKLRPYLDFQ